MATKRKFSLLLLFIIFHAHRSTAQSFPFTEAYNETKKQEAMAAYPESKWDSLRCAWYGECLPLSPQPQTVVTSCPLAKRMFGWHAIGTLSSSYQWALLSVLSYFSYQVDPATGNATNASSMAAFPTNATVTTALANGVKVSLCVTLFQSTTEFSTFFGSANAQNNLITNLINLISSANATGINIDFEGPGLNTTYVSQFGSFLSSLSSQLHTAIPGSELSIDLQGSYSSSTSLLNTLIPSVDLFILMGYDYYWQGQFYPGPIAPTYQFPKATADPNGHGNVSNDLNNVLKIVDKNKVILAMPYYGRRWRTTNGCVIPADGNAATISTQTYSQYRDNASGYYSNTLRETNSFNAYHCFDASAVPNQQFIDDTYSLQKKYDIIRQRGLAGAAVWRLGYDAGYNDCWNLVNNNLSNCSITPARDTIYDMGGPTGNYHNAENYTFTIAPAGAGTVALSFLSFDLEQGFDSLRIYNGPSTASELIGSFTGNTIPATTIATNGSMTIQFHADNATNKTGYTAIYTSNCQANTWLGTVNTAWEEAGNWSCGKVPDENTNVTINSGTVVVNSNVAIRTLILNSAVSFTVSANNNFTVLH
ncbi:MAG: glycosyl hydrolase family 18 protein [Ferruginibacter sp.]